jgi:hypothetical protein
MQNLDPRKVYNEKEINELCQNTGITQKIQVCQSKIGISHGFGTILKKINNNYQLYSELVSSFEKYF